MKSASSTRMARGAFPNHCTRLSPSGRSRDSISGPERAGLTQRAIGVISARALDDMWNDLVEQWRAVAIRKFHEHSCAIDGTCTRCREHWPCTVTTCAALALEMHEM